MGYNLNRWIFQQTGVAKASGAFVDNVADKLWIYNFSVIIGSVEVLCAVFWCSELSQRYIEVRLTTFTRFIHDKITQL